MVMATVNLLLHHPVYFIVGRMSTLLVQRSVCNCLTMIVGSSYIIQGGETTRTDQPISASPYITVGELTCVWAGGNLSMTEDTSL